MVDEPDWSLEKDDVIEWTGSMSGDEAFTNLILVCIDAEDGSKRTAEASVSFKRLGLLERLVRAREPMTASGATSLAKEAANVLGGVPTWRGVGTLWADRPIAHRSGERRPQAR